jgi:hypothetical protein
MKKKLLGIFLASVAVLTAIGAAGIVNQSINAAPGEVPVVVQVGNLTGYSIVDPVDTSGRPVITGSPLAVQISHNNIYR